MSLFSHLLPIKRTMTQPPFDASAILPWEWDQVIVKIQDRPVCERDLIVQYIMDGGCGYETGSLLAKLALQLPDNVALHARHASQPTDCNARALATFNRDEELVVVLTSNRTKPTLPKQRRRYRTPLSRTPNRKTRTKKQIEF